MSVDKESTLMILTRCEMRPHHLLIATYSMLQFGVLVELIMRKIYYLLLHRKRSFDLSIKLIGLIDYNLSKRNNSNAEILKTQIRKC